MWLFGFKKRPLIFIVDTNTKVTISRCHEHTETRLVLSGLKYNNLTIKNSIIMSAELNVKQFVAGVFGIIRHDDGTPITATFANETFSSSDTSIFTAEVDPGDGPDTAIVDVKGVAEGPGSLHVEVDASYTDPGTGQLVTKHKTADIQVTITAAPPSETETDLVVNFGTPQTQG